MSDSLWLHESQHTRPPCPSPTPGIHSNSCPSSRWCHPAISSSVIPFSSCPQTLPASVSFRMSQLFAWGGQKKVTLCLGVHYTFAEQQQRGKNQTNQEVWGKGSKSKGLFTVPNSADPPREWTILFTFHAFTVLRDICTSYFDNLLN